MMYSFQLCACCKLPYRNGLDPVSIGPDYLGSVCKGCQKIIAGLVQAEMDKTQIPAAIRPYLERQG